MKMNGVSNDQGHGNQGNEGEPSVHGGHEGHGQNEQNQGTEHRSQLLGQEVFGGLNVGSTPLDDIAGAVFHVPGEGQVLDVGIEGITHGFGEGFRRTGIAHQEAILAEDFQQRHGQDGQAHDPQVFAQVFKAADAVDDIHHSRAEGGGIAADGVIDCGADDLRGEHIRQGSDGRHEDADDKQRFAAFEELPDECGFMHLRLFVCFPVQ